MKKILYTAFAGLILLTTLSLSSCIKDKGNEIADKPLNAVRLISGIDEGYQVLPGEMLEVTPVLDYELGEEPDRFEYEWVAVSNNNYVLSTEKDLKIKIEGFLALEKTHRIIFRVKDTKTGMIYAFPRKTSEDENGAVVPSPFSVNTTNTLSYGYLFLTQIGNDINMDMYGFFTQDREFYLAKNVLSNPNEENRLALTDRKALGLLAVKDPFAPKANDTSPTRKRFSIWVMTDKSCDRVNANDFSWEPAYNISTLNIASSTFFDGGVSIPDKMVGVGSAGTTSLRWMFYHYKGNWYSYEALMTGNLGAIYPFRPINITQDEYDKGEPTPFETSPYIGYAGRVGNCCNVMLFDTKAKKFMMKTSNRSGTTNLKQYCSCIEMINSRIIGESLGFSFEEAGMELTYMDARSDLRNYAIINYPNKSEYKYAFLDFSVTDATGSVGIKRFQPFKTSNDAIIAKTKKFAMFKPDFDYLMCLTNEGHAYSIYCGDVNTLYNISNVVNPDGHEIICFKTLPDNKYDYTTEIQNNNRLFVVTYDKSKPKDAPDCCTMRVFEPVPDSGTGALRIATWKNKAGETKEMVFTGLGYVVDIDWKEM